MWQRNLVPFIMLLLGCSPSGAPFQDIFSISVALSLGVVLQLSNITPGGCELRVEGRNTRWNRDNKKTLKTILSAVFSLDHKGAFPPRKVALCSATPKWTAQNRSEWCKSTLVGTKKKIDVRRCASQFHFLSTNIQKRNPKFRETVVIR